MLCQQLLDCDDHDEELDIDDYNEELLDCDVHDEEVEMGKVQEKVKTSQLLD